MKPASFTYHRARSVHDAVALLADRLSGAVAGFRNCRSASPFPTRAPSKDRFDDAYRGRINVQVGPITAGFAGVAEFVEVSPDDPRLRLPASGIDTCGAGDVDAEVEIPIAPGSGASSTLPLRTDLVIRRRFARFGKGAMSVISDRLISQFPQNLRTARTVSDDSAARSSESISELLEVHRVAESDPRNGVGFARYQLSNTVRRSSSGCGVRGVLPRLAARPGRSQSKLIEVLNRG